MDRRGGGGNKAAWEALVVVGALLVGAAAGFWFSEQRNAARYQAVEDELAKLEPPGGWKRGNEGRAPVVDEAENRDDEGAKIHERRPPLRRSLWSLPSVGRSPLWFKPSKKLAHGVN